MDWVQDCVTNPNFKFFHTVTFQYLLAFSMYNEAVRENHSENMLAARVTFSPLFFLANHPHYREVHLRDMLERAQYPENMREYLQQRESFTTSGENKSGQGADFIHEEVNALIKSFLPPGIPTAEIWQRVCQKGNYLKDAKQRCLSTSEIRSQQTPRLYNKFEQEVLMMHRELRKSSWVKCPGIVQPLVGIEGKN